MANEYGRNRKPASIRELEGNRSRRPIPKDGSGHVDQRLASSQAQKLAAADAWTWNLAFGFTLDSWQPDAALEALVREYVRQWQTRTAEIVALASPARPWFERHADNPQPLVDAARGYRRHMERFPHGAGCRCERCAQRTGECSEHCKLCFPKDATND